MEVFSALKLFALSLTLQSTIISWHSRTLRSTTSSMTTNAKSCGVVALQREVLASEAALNSQNAKSCPMYTKNVGTIWKNLTKLRKVKVTRMVTALTPLKRSTPSKDGFKFCSIWLRTHSTCAIVLRWLEEHWRISCKKVESMSLSWLMSMSFNTIGKYFVTLWSGAQTGRLRITLIAMTGSAFGTKPSCLRVACTSGTGRGLKAGWRPFLVQEFTGCGANGSRLSIQWVAYVMMIRNWNPPVVAHCQGIQCPLRIRRPGGCFWHKLWPGWLQCSPFLSNSCMVLRREISSLVTAK